MLFVGTTHSDRYKLVKRIEEQIIKMGGLCLTWFYFSSKILYYKMKIKTLIFVKFQFIRFILSQCLKNCCFNFMLVHELLLMYNIQSKQV